MTYVWHLLNEGAKRVGRVLGPDSNFYTTALTTMVVLDDGEAIDSDRVKAECGAMAMASVHYAYDQYRNFGHQPPNAYAEIWEDYTALLDSYSKVRLHQRIHAGHNCWVLEEEERFLTPRVLKASSMIGTQDALLQQLHGLRAVSYTHLTLPTKA